MRGKGACLLALAFAAGCATQQQQAPPPPDPALACIRALPSRPDFAPLSAKVALAAVEDQSFAMMTIGDRATEEDKPVIAAWVNARQECIRLGDAWSMEYRHPQIRVIAAGAFGGFLAASADLYAGKITYGEFATARQQLLSQVQRDAANVVQRLDEQQSASDEQRKNRAMMYLLNQQRQAPAFQPQQPYQPPRPTTTNCYRFGNQINCTSY